MQAGRSSTMRARYCKTRTKPSRKRALLQAQRLQNSRSATQRIIPSKFCRKAYGHFSRQCQTCTSDCTIGTTKTCDGIRDGRLQLELIAAPPKASAVHDLRYEE